MAWVFLLTDIQCVVFPEKNFPLKKIFPVTSCGTIPQLFIFGFKILCVLVICVCMFYLCAYMCNACENFLWRQGDAVGVPEDDTDGYEQLHRYKVLRKSSKYS